jgi:hypothetical protein
MNDASPIPPRPLRLETEPGVSAPDGAPLPTQPGARDLDEAARDAAIATPRPIQSNRGRA